jgi:glucose-1-phosphate cytidylyltransferase
MEVVILCGGQGTRLRDVAADLPKPMVPIGGRPILWHIMKGFARFDYTDFILCLGHQGWVIKRYFLDYQLNGVDFTINLADPTEVQVHGPAVAENWRVTMAETGTDAMTGCRIKRVERYVRGNCFLLTYGDGVADVDVDALVRFHRAHGRIGTVTAVRPPGRFGEIELDGALVREFNEKPCTSQGWINGGFFCLDRRIFDRLDDDPGLVFEQEPLIRLARDGELMAYEHPGFWQPMDTSREYRYLNELWEQGRAPWMTWETPASRPASASRERRPVRVVKSRN